MAVFFVVADVHGFYYQMQLALSQAGFDIKNKNHIFVSLGDLCDRGPHAEMCLDFVNSLPSERKILIRGNHEDLLEEAINRRAFLYHDYRNGTVDTVLQLTGHTPDSPPAEILTDMRINTKWNTYIASCIDYFENEKYVFVHGWIPCRQESSSTYVAYEKTDWRHGNWEAARWFCCFNAWQSGVRVPGKTIVAGHWHTSYGHSLLHHKGPEFGEGACFDIFKGSGIIGMDACTAYSNKVNCLKLTGQRTQI